MPRKTRHLIKHLTSKLPNFTTLPIVIIEENATLVFFLIFEWNLAMAYDLIFCLFVTNQMSNFGGRLGQPKKNETY
jgi:hypothetical protein